jgi:hypothetical protein
MDGIRTFTLLETEKLEKHAATIAEVLFRLPAAAVGTKFTVSRGGGWISFADRSKLWSEAKKQSLPHKQTDARVAALRFFAARREAMTASRPFIESQLPSLIPPDDWLTDAAIDPIPHPRKPQFDHWLCRFGVSVRCSDDVDEPRAEVLGAGIDLRIGDDGEVIAADWRWRPAIDPRTRPRSPKPEGARRIIYRFNDQATRQTFLAPYYEVVEGEDVRLVPASDRSLSCNVLSSEGPGPVTLLAIASGGSGNYAYTWGRIAIAAFPPVIELLSAARNVRVDLSGGRSMVVSQVDFGAEAGDVLLHVADNTTGAVIQLRRAIYPLAPNTELLG